MREARNQQVVLRISGPLKAEIEREAESDRRTVSDFLRILVADAISARRGSEEGAQAA